MSLTRRWGQVGRKTYFKSIRQSQVTENFDKRHIIYFLSFQDAPRYILYVTMYCQTSNLGTRALHQPRGEPVRRAVRVVSSQCHLPIGHMSRLVRSNSNLIHNNNNLTLL